MDFGQDKVVPTDLAYVMSSSYIDYAMSVIVARALPDVRDGMKPVHRRILYAMQEAGMGSTKPYKKSARIVGEVLGKYHPHGDSSVYDAIVRMAQDFSIRYLLADGHGNFGSVDGDPPAAMRYTEVRMSKISELMLQDIDKETVDFMPNYDESMEEPTVLPAKFPQLLVNGSEGIAVGMATKIPPHNLCETIDATLALIDNPEIELEDLMKLVKGPDFPTGGLILGTEGIRSAYLTGRGRIKMRARAHIETLSNGKPRIVVTELPYQVNKTSLIEKIAELARDKVVEGITDLRDESDREGMRIVIELRKDVVANVLLNQLYKHTQLQDTFGAIMLALVDGRPQIMNLKTMLEHYVAHQKDVITRRTRFELAKAEARAHILQGLTIALDHLDAVITTIRESRTADIARAALMEGFDLSEKQAQAILDLRLQRLTGLEREKIEEEYQEVLKTIEWLKSVLADEGKIYQIIKEELTKVREQFGDERRTEITIDTSEMNVEDLIAQEDVVLTLTHDNYIKRVSLDTYRVQKRNGQGTTSGKKESDFVEHLLITTTHHTVMFFTTKGRVYQKKAYEVAESSRKAKGMAIVNLLPLEEGENITAVIPVKEFRGDRFLFMATKRGIVKKTVLAEFDNQRKSGMIALKLDEDDELIGVKFTNGQQKIILGTRDGFAITFDEADVRDMGRTARGVHGIRLREEDVVVGMDTLQPGLTVLTITAEGYGKRTAVEDYNPQKRGGKGVINLKLSEKTGVVVGLKTVKENHEVMFITINGQVLRTTLDDVRTIGRNAQGVKVMQIGVGDHIASFALSEAKSE